MPKLQTLVRDLQRRKARERRGLSVVEGVRLLEEALASGLPVRGALFSGDVIENLRISALRESLGERGVPAEQVDAASFKDLADTETSQGVLAVIEIKQWSLSDIQLEAGGVVLVLDAVQDPGNVGGLIRSAAGLGAAGTLCLEGTVDPWNPKALRGAMGATFRHPVVLVTDDGLGLWLDKTGTDLWVASSEGESVRSTEKTDRVAIVVGNEGAGVSVAVSALPHRIVGVPMTTDIESLNVGVAAGILLFEVLNR